MDIHYSFSELINVDQLQASLERMYTILQIHATVINPEGTIIASSDPMAERQRRTGNPINCLRRHLANTHFTDPCTQKRCSHGLEACIFPIAPGAEPIAYLIINHLAIIGISDKTSGKWQGADSQNPLGPVLSMDQFTNLKKIFEEYSNLWAEMARMRGQHIEDMKASEERDRLFQMVSDNMIDSLWMMDLNLTLTYGSPSVFRKRGYSMEELRHMPLEKHITPESYQKAVEMMVESLKNPAEYENHQYTVDMEYYCKDGSTFWSETHLRFIRDDKGEITGILGVGRDITERKQAEEEIRMLNQALESRVKERTAQLRAVNRDLESFSYSVAHDLKAPLRAMDGYSQILLEEYQGQLNGNGRIYLERIRSASRSMSQLIDDLLKLSHVSRQDIVIIRMDLAKMAREIIADLRNAYPARNIRFICPDTLPVYADPNLMRIALGNLITNAWKFTEKRENAVIEIGSNGPSIDPTIYVKDNGIGFEMTNAGKLFQPFQRLHRRDEFDGNGIGLAIVHKIIERHGGSIWAEGFENKGACFFFNIPSQPEGGGRRLRPAGTSQVIIPSGIQTR